MQRSVSRVPGRAQPPRVPQQDTKLSNTALGLLIGGAVVAVGAGLAWYFFSGEKGSSPAQLAAATEEAEESSEDEGEVTVPVKATTTPQLKNDAAVTRGTSGQGARQLDVDEDESDEGEDAVITAPPRTDLISKKDLLNMLQEMMDAIMELQANLRSLHESGELSSDEIVDAHSEGIGNIEKSLHMKYRVNQDLLNQAYQVYDGDKDIDHALEQLQQLFAIGDVDCEAPEGLTCEEFVEKFRKQNKILMEAIDDIVDDVKASGKRGDDAAMYFQMQLVARLQKIQDDAQKVVGLSEKEFMGAFMKFGNEPTVIQASMEVQMFTQQKQMELKAL